MSEVVSIIVGDEGPRGPTGLTGPTGPAGSTGPAGPAGPNNLPSSPTVGSAPEWNGTAWVVGGSTVLNGSGAPGSGVGNVGDWYWDSVGLAMYGPKALVSQGIGAFPTTSILDSAVRANESPLSDGGDWSGPIWTTDVAMSLVGDEIVVTGGASSSAYWVPSSGLSTTPGVEIYCTLSSTFVDTTTNVPYLFWCVQNPDSGTFDGYYAKVYAGQFYPHVVNNGGASGLSTSSATLSAGDSIGVRMVGSTITLWHKPSAGSWTQIGTLTDATYTGGYVGIGLGAGSGTGLAAVGGGEVVVGSSPEWPSLPTFSQSRGAIFAQDTAPAPPTGTEYVWFEMDGSGNILDILSGKA